MTPGFTRNDIKAHIEKKLVAYNAAVEMRLKRTGEEFIVLARTNGAYTDRTGNLRNSAFYRLMYDGRVISESFATAGSEGAAKSRSFVDKIAKGYKKGYALICGAGMEYAAAVESQGKEVITGSSQIVEENLKQSLNRINSKTGG